MQINKIDATTFNKKVTILASENKHKPLLYNELLELSRDRKLATNFGTNQVVFPEISDTIIRKIKRLGIKISKPAKNK